MTFIREKRTNEELGDYFDDGQKAAQSKKSKTSKIVDELFVHYNEKSNEAYPLPNMVSLSSKSLAKIGNPTYLRIGRFVVPVVRDRNLAEDQMEMFSVFTNCLIDKQQGEADSDQELVWIHPFNPALHNCGMASSVKFSVYPWRSFDYIGKPKDETVIHEDTLKWETMSQVGNQVVRIGQEFFVRHPIVGPLKLVVEECHFEDDDDIDLLEGYGFREFGMLTQNTCFSFKSGSKKRLMIVAEEDPSVVHEFCMRIVKVREIAQKGFHSILGGIYEKDWHRGLEPLPMVVPLKKVKENILSVWEEKLIYPGMTTKFKTGQREYTVKFTAAKVYFGETIIPEGKNLKAFRLNRDHHIKIDTDRSVILTDSKKNAQTATELSFKICGIKRAGSLEKNQLNWMNVDAILSELKKQLRYLPLKSKCVVNIRNHLLLLKLVEAKGIKKPEVEGAKQLWEVDQNTKMTLFSKPSMGLELLHGTIRFPIQTMQVVVTQKPKEDDEENIFTKKKKLPKIVLDEAAVAEAFKAAVPSDGFLSENKEIYGVTKKGIKLTFKIRQIRPAGAMVLQDNHGFLNKFSANTQVTWTGETNGDVTIERPYRQVDIGKIHDELIEAGLGGLPKELEQIILEIKMSRGEYSRYMKDLGIAPTRGLILWGPPGTGKTKIARNLGKILGISEEKTSLYTGSEIWDKWLGNSEKNVMKMFAAAREEQNRLGDKSQMHLLIIDEIDAFLQKREGASRRHETSVVTTFLAQLDGITSTGKDPLNNIIVIGMTNQPHTIDEAVKREGRLGTHIHIGLPDHEGRKEIFRIHCKQLLGKGCIGEDVNFDKLAELSSGKTGAFIEGIVAKAAKIPIARLQEAKVSAAEINNHPLVKVTMADFSSALKEATHLSKAKNKKEELVLQEGASLEALTANMRRMGIVGAPAAIMEFIRDCKMAQNYKRLELPQAVLLYGPSGTGKSTIARSLEKLLGLDGNRFKHFSASQLWPKRGSDLKEMMSGIIQPAKNASRDLGKEAPLHVVVVDEIDWIYAGNNFSEKESGAMMGHFLREIQNLFHAEGYDVNNLMIVGIASGRVPVDILKGFNLGTSAKLIEFKLPNAKERKAVLNLYLEEYIHESRIDEKTIQELVEISKDKAGSFLKVWVKEAVNKMYRRAAEQGLSENALLQHPCGKLLLEDFRESYSQLAGEERWKGNYL